LEVEGDADDDEVVVVGAKERGALAAITGAAGLI
jgi:hypothetical protein